MYDFSHPIVTIFNILNIYCMFAMTLVRENWMCRCWCVWWECVRLLWVLTLHLYAASDYLYVGSSDGPKDQWALVNYSSNLFLSLCMCVSVCAYACLHVCVYEKACQAVWDCGCDAFSANRTQMLLKKVLSAAVPVAEYQLCPAKNIIERNEMRLQTLKLKCYASFSR